MTVEAIKVAIEQLKEPERRELADWIEQFEEQAWDAGMELDLSSAVASITWSRRSIGKSMTAISLPCERASALGNNILDLA
ncbi:MAG: hypothetical protein ACLQVM_21770 [Terriglobia bacterium]